MASSTSIKKVKVSDLIPYANNSRTHSDEQVLQIAASIKEFGFLNPIIIDGDNGIIAGHGRVMAAKKLGIDELPCIDARHLTEAQKKAYIIADNKLALNAGWDDEILRIEFDALKELDFDLELTGFSLDEIGELEIEEIAPEYEEDADGEITEPPAEPVTKEGDVWILGKHRLMCGDSTSIDAVDKLMDGNRVDMVFTDPPYGMNLDTDYSSMKSEMFKGKTGGAEYSKVIGDNEDFSPELINTVFASFGYCKEIFLWGADYYAELLPEKNSGSWVVWDKRLDDSADKMYGSCFELCWSKSRHKREIARVKWAGIFGMEKEHDKKRVHPTQKPVNLITWFFDKWGKDSISVVDLFGGSGSTLIACEKTNRKAYLMELDPKYCDVIINRWQTLTGKDAILESTGEKFNDL